jgi:hypothetical protein
MIAPAVLLLLLSAMLYGSAQQPSAAQRLEFSQLTLKLSSTKEDFVQLEPIPIILNLRNETDQPIVGHSALDFSNNFVKLFLIRENGETSEIQRLSPVTGNTAASPKKFGPSENLEAKQALAFQLDKTFPHPGNYRIQAVLYDAGWSSEVRSNVLTIHILKPEGLNLQAFEYIKSLGASSYFFSGVGFSSKEQARASLEDFINRFGETAYADYAAFSLGEFYFYDKEYQRADKRFNHLAKRTDFVLADKAQKYLEKIKREDKASKPIR